MVMKIQSKCHHFVHACDINTQAKEVGLQLHCHDFYHHHPHANGSSVYLQILCNSLLIYTVHEAIGNNDLSE